jgi:hypothetical protein
MQKWRGSRRRGKQHRAKEDTNWAETGPDRSAQAGRPNLFRGPVGLPFDLVTSLAIYSPPDREQRINQFVIRRRGAEKLEGHHLGDEGRGSCLGSP